MGSIKLEIPKHCVPAYVDHALISESPPGHRFSLYFSSLSEMWEVGRVDKRAKRDIRNLYEKEAYDKIKCKYGNRMKISPWLPLKDTKSRSLTKIECIGTVSETLLKELRARQRFFGNRDSEVHMIEGVFSSPLTIGLGNPHPVENGFAFLSPYGLPYIPGASIKGVLRRAAEDMALFNDNSKWTIPLVWLYLGFDERSAYITPVNSLIEEVKEEARRYKEALERYTKEQAGYDELLRKWIEYAVNKEVLPKELKDITESPCEFLGKLREESDSGKQLRAAVSWKGLIRFWDAFPELKKLAVDIMNPHYGDYYKGSDSPHDSQVPKPMFFLTIPPETRVTFVFEIKGPIEKFKSSIKECNWKELITETFRYTCDHFGFGGKTSLGYGEVKLKK